MSLPRVLAPSSRRLFHSTTASSSHIGSQPITIPPSVTLQLPLTSIPLTSTRNVQAAPRVLTVTGPLGSHSLRIFPTVILHPPSDDHRQLVIAVHDSHVKAQKSVWGTTRSLISNAVKGVSEGFTVDLRLVGVGYRVTTEPIPPVFRNLQRQFAKPKSQKPGFLPQTDRPLPSERLNMKLGFSHPVLIDIPADIKVSIPAPTKILLSGTDKERLGMFAATIRKWRKPEPYRGKASCLQP